MGKNVKPENYRTCVCGQTCKGELALRNHAKVCEMEQERARLFIQFSAQGKYLSDVTFRSAWNKRRLLQAIDTYARKGN